jgi:hypothetical protein
MLQFDYILIWYVGTAYVVACVSVNQSVNLYTNSVK